MAKLGKPKGSRNKKTLEKLAAASKEPAERHRTNSVNSYPTQNNDMPLLLHTTSLGNLPGSEANLPGQIDSEIFGVGTASEMCSENQRY
jgi:hypothetical protein